ncbi:PX-domain-containing protein [Lentinus tigrinus ALCF2SS1-6]|uniref:PX-domain-containing protein n=1 Tax=Lentinus tigrinus ALCF2SS1-6 TaxID=1328759 RepID=A0A5C2RTB6_9APHY|nr:PX-domain-containing protein [Lentinus tigrinus ALCF2SS1-6]
MAETASSPPKTGLLQVPQLLSRPHSSELEFDSGINTSAAWTVSLTNPHDSPRLSLNGAGASSSAGTEPKPTPEEDTTESVYEEGSFDAEEARPARALYSFQGKAEFRELTQVEAGDELEIVREDVGEGWSLARLRDTGEEVGGSETGLIPRSYYIFTADFVYSEGLEVPPQHTRGRSRREASTGSITPRGGSPVRETEARPIVPQTTGEWFPSFRRSLLGGKSLNRFSSFVTSGAEEFVLQGTSEDTSASHPPRLPSDLDEDDVKRESVLGHMVEAERHFVEAGPSWRTKVPAFRVLVHSPSKRTSTITGAYTMYTVTTAFGALSHSRTSSGSSDPDTDADADADAEPPSPMRITVHRRFSHFVALHTALTRLLPGIALPPLPEKQYAGRFSDDFVEARRGDLERYINRVARHPIARYAEVLTFFLGCESDTEWKKKLPYYLSLPPKGPSFFANVYHPAFNVDSDEASEAIDRFVNHTRAVGKGVQGLRNIFGKVREARVEMSKAERLLSYSILSTITAKPLAQAPTTGLSEEEEEEGQNTATHGHVNQDGAWCWREGCDTCLKLTKAMQKTSETLQIVADLYDDHARRTQLATHEAFKSVAHPTTLYAPVVDTHRSTLSRYHDSIREGREDEEMAARCETVLNTTMAEMDTYHTQKVEDFQELAKEHLDGEIALYEQILSRLRTARKAFDEPQYEELGRGPRQPSIYERELEHPRLNPAPLSQPCPHVFDSAPMRPVSVAIQEGVGMLLGAPGRASVFGKFW